MKVSSKFALRLDRNSRNLLFALMASIVIVFVTGFVVGISRVELSSPFNARQAAVQVFFYDGLTGKYISPNPALLLSLSLQKRLGYEAEIYRPSPNFVRSILQSLLSWLSLWLALGLSFWLFKRSLSTSKWFQIGAIAGSLVIWRLLQALTVSYWLWLPNWRSDLVIALLDIVQGHPVQAHLVWAVLWRSFLWLLTGLATFVHIFFVMRRTFQLPFHLSLLGLIVTYMAAWLIYALSTLRFWQ